MSTTNSQVLPAPPSIIRVLLAGFDTVSNHLYLVIFSIGIDLLLWFGPRVRLFELFKDYLDKVVDAGIYNSESLNENMQVGQETLMTIAERFNLVSTIRTYPVGVASLMAGRGPLETPYVSPINWEISSAWTGLLIWLVLGLFGLGLGTIYFTMIARSTLQASLRQKISLQSLIRRYLQVLMLTIFMFFLLIGLMIPIGCILPFIMAGGGSFARIIMFIYAIVMIWLFFPLVFSPFGIFVYDDKMWASILRGSRLVRKAAPITMLFVLIIVILSQGLDMLWNIPVDQSWFLLIGVLGHAFIAAGLLAATFIFFRDVNSFVHLRDQQLSVV